MVTLYQTGNRAGRSVNSYRLSGGNQPHGPEWHWYFIICPFLLSVAFSSILFLRRFFLPPYFTGLVPGTHIFQNPFSVVYWFSLCHDEVLRQELESAPKQKPLFFSWKSEAKAWSWLTLSFAVASVGGGRGKVGLFVAGSSDPQCFPAGPGLGAGTTSRFLGGKPES